MDLATQYVQWDWHPAGEGRIAVEATVDPSALTLTYDAMTITVTNLTIGFTNDFTAGFGQVSRVETILVFDPILCHATNLGTWRLTPGMDGVYQIAWTFACSGSCPGASPCFPSPLAWTPSGSTPRDEQFSVLAAPRANPWCFRRPRTRGSGCPSARISAEASRSNSWTPNPSLSRTASIGSWSDS